jgi:hypothetical protein
MAEKMYFMRNFHTFFSNRKIFFVGNISLLSGLIEISCRLREKAEKSTTFEFGKSEVRVGRCRIEGRFTCLKQRDEPALAALKKSSRIITKGADSVVRLNQKEWLWKMTYSAIISFNLRRPSLWTAHMSDGNRGVASDRLISKKERVATDLVEPL